jgi:hypothetical protein
VTTTLTLGPIRVTPAARRRSTGVSRKLRLLRAHDVIRKVPHSHRYHVTPAGRTAITTVLMALQMTVRQLTTLAA